MNDRQPIPLAWDSVTYDDEITRLSSTAFYEGIKANTSLEVRIAMLEELREPVTTKEEAMELTGLGVDYSGPGRPSWVIVSPIPKSDVVRRLRPH